MSQITDLLDLAASQLERAQIPEVQVVVRAVGLELVVVLDELGRDRSRVGDDLRGVLFELGLSGLLERDGNAGDRLCEWIDPSAISKQKEEGNARCCEGHLGRQGRRHC